MEMCLTTEMSADIVLCFEFELLFQFEDKSVDVAEPAEESPKQDEEPVPRAPSTPRVDGDAPRPTTANSRFVRRTLAK